MISLSSLSYDMLKIIVVNNENYAKETIINFLLGVPNNKHFLNNRN